jgi:hypothetical protein
MSTKPIRTFIQSIDDAQRKQVIEDHQEFEKKGVTGDTALRRLTEQFMREAKLSDDAFPTVMMMDRIAFECYRFYAMRELESSAHASAQASPSPDDHRAFGSNYHGAMMNLPCEVPQTMLTSESSRMAYKTGHRDARHAAAELALGADREVDQLRDALRGDVRISAKAASILVSSRPQAGKQDAIDELRAGLDLLEGRDPEGSRIQRARLSRP